LGILRVVQRWLLQLSAELARDSHFSKMPSRATARGEQVSAISAVRF
jgi:hypothetical protein